MTEQYDDVSVPWRASVEERLELMAQRLAEVEKREQLAWSEAKRVRRLTRAQRERLQVLAIWCESGQCCVGRVYRLRAGLLLDSPGEGDFRSIFSKAGQSGKGWGRSSTVWLNDQQHRTGLPVTCRCSHTTQRTMSIRAVITAAASNRPTVGVSGLATD